MKNQAGKL